MANTFREQAEERLLKSSAFMRKAETLLGDDVVYRSVLADAVSAVKNMLQGYLLLRVSQTPSSAVTARWQEIAATNRMPELIQACGEAGLNLSGVAVEIKRLNNQRNLIAHDDPHTRIERKEAARAVELAREVRDRIKSAVQGRLVPKSLPARAARAAQVARAAVSGQLRMAPAEDDDTFTGAVLTAAGGTNGRDAQVAEADPAVVAAPSAVIQTEAKDTPANGVSGAHAAMATAESESEDGGDARDSDEVPAVVASPRGRSGARIRRALVRALVAAALLIAGAAAGAGIAVPVATGHAPAWLGFASGLFAPTNAARARPEPTPTATAIPAPSGATTLGALAISAPLCQGSGTVALTLTNTGTAPIAWAVGSPDGAVTLAVAPGTASAAAQVGTLPPGGSATLTISGGRGGSHIVITAPAGAVELLPPSC